MQQGLKLQNMVTLGATLLSNTTDTYASFAVLMDQAIGRAVIPLTSLAAVLLQPHQSATCNLTAAAQLSNTQHVIVNGECQS